ncbi:tetratricopeptide repeat protein [Helicobacter felis]|uniref:Beta-lactamase n=1 Tax=Helicobacter felis (strain ATCC 49179 / CCUG 28539 / NCTC 12436 / CS1) TaxID=936155 RepID=E7AB13_HELFC|nr:tetratricopeptide repeat protein [Helicobacter felis]CBY83625.1 HcpD [Helicobacter felis ATCC 49179]
MRIKIFLGILGALLLGGCAREAYLKSGNKARYAQDFQQAIADYQRAGELGSARAYENLGFFYWEGAPKDITKAVVSFKKACKLGSKQACALVARPPESQTNTYLEGLLQAGYANDRPKIMAYLNKMTQMGIARAYLARGLLEEKSDPKQAIMDYKKAGQMGDVQAYRTLGWIYEQGLLGVHKDIDQAIKYYQRGAKLGDPYSCHSLGVLYWDVQSVRRNRKKAKKYFLKGCDLGFKGSCDLLKVEWHIVKP